MEHPNVYMMSSYFFDRLLGCPARTSFKGSKIICIDTDVSEPNQIADKHVKRGTSSSGVHHVKHQLDNYNYECVRRWSSRRSFHKARLIYCPINVQNSHWVACAGHLDNLLVKNGEVMTWPLTHLINLPLTLTVILPQQVPVIFMDSYASTTDMYTKAMVKYLQDDVKDKGVKWL